MVATAATSAFFQAISPSPDSGSEFTMFGGMPANVRVKLSSCSSRGLQVKTNTQVQPKVHETIVGLPRPLEGVVKTEDEAPHHSRNQLHAWSMLLASITTIFLVAEKKWMRLVRKPRRRDALIDPFGIEKVALDGLVFRQNFSIRSYETGVDRTVSIETVLNHFQETALNHWKSFGLLDRGFGSPKMSKRNLIWVLIKMKIVVDRYPTWGDVVQVETYVSPSGKNGLRHNWIVRDCKTGDILTRASGVCVMMNKLTRRLSKFPEEVRRELEPCYVDSNPVVEEDSRELPKLDENTANYIRTGLTPKWSDVDINQHVNNAKYIGWILESTPVEILESHELSSISIEFRKECGRDSVLQSLTAVSNADVGNLAHARNIECQHFLRLDGGAEILKARTEWSPKQYANKFI